MVQRHIWIRKRGCTQLDIGNQMKFPTRTFLNISDMRFVIFSNNLRFLPKRHFKCSIYNKFSGYSELKKPSFIIVMVI